MRLAGMALGLIALAVLVGCGDSEAEYQTYDEAIKNQVAAQEEIATILAGIKGPAQMEPAKAKLKKHFQKYDELARKFQALGKPSAAVAERLEHRWGSSIKASLTELSTENARVAKLPGGTEFIQSLQSGK